MDLLDITRTAHSPVNTLRMGGHEFSVLDNNFSLPANHNETGGKPSGYQVDRSFH